MGAMPAGGKGNAFLFRLEVDEVDPVLAETKRGLDRLDEPGAVLVANRYAILDDLDPRAEPKLFVLGVGPNDLATEPDAQVALLLEKGEKIRRLGLGWDGDPESEKPAFSCTLPADFVGDRFRRLRPDLRAHSSDKKRARPAA